jgi:hypothetical protein
MKYTPIELTKKKGKKRILLLLQMFKKDVIRLTVEDRF